MHQQDAHICSILYDEDTALFAVFDGHGGAEVALYCAYKIPLYLKNIESYKNGDYEKALIDTFLGVDDTLLDEEVIQKMKRMVPDERAPSETDSERDEDEEDLRLLCREGKMPLNELLANLHEQNPLIEKEGEPSGSSSGSKSLAQILRDQCAKWTNGATYGSDSSDDDDTGGSTAAQPSSNNEVLYYCERYIYIYIHIIVPFTCSIFSYKGCEDIIERSGKRTENCGRKKVSKYFANIDDSPLNLIDRHKSMCNQSRLGMRSIFQNIVKTKCVFIFSGGDDVQTEDNNSIINTSKNEETGSTFKS